MLFYMLVHFLIVSPANINLFMETRPWTWKFIAAAKSCSCFAQVLVVFLISVDLEALMKMLKIGPSLDHDHDHDHDHGHEHHVDEHTEHHRDGLRLGNEGGHERHTDHETNATWDQVCK